MNPNPVYESQSCYDITVTFTNMYILIKMKFKIVAVRKSKNNTLAYQDY